MKNIMELFGIAEQSESTESSEESPEFKKLSVNERALLKKSITTFKNKLIEKSLKFSEINQCVKAFNLVHSEGVALDLRQCTSSTNPCFDVFGNWNFQAQDIDENTIVIDKFGKQNTPQFQELSDRIEEILYPNILCGHEKISFLQKMVLCALIYSIQTSLLIEFLPEKEDFTFEKIKKLGVTNQIIYRAVNVAVTHALHIITFNISHSIETKNDNKQEDIDFYLSKLPHFHSKNKNKAYIVSNENEKIEKGSYNSFV